MTEAVGLLWMIFQPVLFGLIGAAVRIEQIQDPYIVGKIWGCQMLQWLLDLGVSYDTIVVIIDTLSLGDLCVVVFPHRRCIISNVSFF